VIPQVSFTYASTDPAQPLQVCFTSQSTTGNDPDTGNPFPGGLVYDWSFGDQKGVDKGDSTCYTYSEEGTYAVTLYATDEQGRIGTHTEVINVPLAAAPGMPTVDFDIDWYLEGTCDSEFQTLVVEPTPNAGTTDAEGTVWSSSSRLAYAWSGLGTTSNLDRPSLRVVYDGSQTEFTILLAVTDTVTLNFDYQEQTITVQHAGGVPHAGPTYTTTEGTLQNGEVAFTVEPDASNQGTFNEVTMWVTKDGGTDPVPITDTAGDTATFVEYLELPDTTSTANIRIDAGTDPEGTTYTLHTRGSVTDSGGLCSDEFTAPIDYSIPLVAVLNVQAYKEDFTDLLDNEYQFVLDGSQSTGNIISYIYTFTQGSPVPDTTSYGSTKTEIVGELLQISSPTPYTVQLTVLDARGNTDVTSVTLVVGGPVINTPPAESPGDFEPLPPPPLQPINQPLEAYFEVTSVVDDIPPRFTLDSRGSKLGSNPPVTYKWREIRKGTSDEVIEPEDDNALVKAYGLEDPFDGNDPKPRFEGPTGESVVHMILFITDAAGNEDSYQQKVNLDGEPDNLNSFSGIEAIIDATQVNGDTFVLRDRSRIKYYDEPIYEATWTFVDSDGVTTKQIQFLLVPDDDTDDPVQPTGPYTYTKLEVSPNTSPGAGTGYQEYVGDVFPMSRNFLQTGLDKLDLGTIAYDQSGTYSVSLSIKTATDSDSTTTILRPVVPTPEDLIQTMPNAYFEYRLDVKRAEQLEDNIVYFYDRSTPGTIRKGDGSLRTSNIVEYKWDYGHALPTPLSMDPEEPELMDGSTVDVFSRVQETITAATPESFENTPKSDFEVSVYSGAGLTDPEGPYLLLLLKATNVVDPKGLDVTHTWIIPSYDDPLNPTRFSYLDPQFNGTKEAVEREAQIPENLKNFPQDALKVHNELLYRNDIMNEKDSEMDDLLDLVNKAYVFPRTNELIVRYDFTAVLIGIATPTAGISEEIGLLTQNSDGYQSYSSDAVPIFPMSLGLVKEPWIKKHSDTRQMRHYFPEVDDLGNRKTMGFPIVFPVSLTVTDEDGRMASVIRPVIYFSDDGPEAKFKWERDEENPNIVLITDQSKEAENIATPTVPGPSMVNRLYTFTDAHGSAWKAIRNIPGPIILDNLRDNQFTFDLNAPENKILKDRYGYIKINVHLYVVDASGGFDHYNDTIDFRSDTAPEADFKSDVPPTGQVGDDDIIFTDLSEENTNYPITSWKWSFGDGTRQDWHENPGPGQVAPPPERTILHKYPTTPRPATYRVTLVVENDEGESSTIFGNVTVT
jgi:PKD repeat protein